MWGFELKRQCHCGEKRGRSDSSREQRRAACAVRESKGVPDSGMVSFRSSSHSRHIPGCRVCSSELFRCFNNLRRTSDLSLVRILARDTISCNAFYIIVQQSYAPNSQQGREGGIRYPRSNMVRGSAFGLRQCTNSCSSQLFAFAATMLIQSLVSCALLNVAVLRQSFNSSRLHLPTERVHSFNSVSTRASHSFPCSSAVDY